MISIWKNVFFCYCWFLGWILLGRIFVIKWVKTELFCCHTDKKEDFHKSHCSQLGSWGKVKGMIMKECSLRISKQIDPVLFWLSFLRTGKIAQFIMILWFGSRMSWCAKPDCDNGVCSSLKNKGLAVTPLFFNYLIREKMDPGC